MITTPSSRQARPSPDVPASVGPWRVLEPLGRGGMGVVYRAQHSVTGAHAALKTVSVSDESLVSSIRREIHALRGVEHPGVVRILDEGIQGGIPWYAMELLEGRTLRDHNQERWRGRASMNSEPTVSVLSASLDALTSTATAEMGPVSIVPRSYQPFAPRPFHRAAGGALRQALTLLRAICRPLAYVHGRGLVHRDLKPDNVFIRDDGAPVLFDFGLAFQFEGHKGRDELQAGGRLMGSPDYMAPEQIRGDLVDARADLYALGCMIYEAVTGAVPFLGDSSSVVLSMHLYAEPLPASELVADVPPELDALIARLLKKRPEDRLGYADDVATALARLGADDAPPPRDEARAPAARPYLYRPRLAGRGEALRQLGEALERARERRQGSLVFVGGESGVGKTRLAVEAAHQAALIHMTVVAGACVAVSAADGRGGAVKAAPLHPFRPLLLAVADRCNELGPGAYDALLGPRGRVLAPYEPSLAQLRGHERYPEPPELPPDAARYRLRTALADTLAAFAATRPVLLVIDDLQWADENSRGVLERLDADYFAAHPVVLLGTYRTEERTSALSSLLAAPWASRIALGRLDRASVGRMVRDMLALDEPPEAFVRTLFEQSEGNPFFIAEYLRAAIQERMIYRDEGYVWRIRAGAEGAAAELSRAARASQPPAALPLPGSLRELVARRLSGLSPGALALARLASVLGRQIEERLLLGAAGLAEVEAMDALAELADRQVLEATEPGQLRFVHDKLRETVYAGIPEPERRALHRAAARTIEQRHRDAPDLALSYPLLAHHYATAGVVDKTLEYLDKAGAQALATGASGDAVDFYRRALELDGALPPEERAPPLRRARWERQLGQALYNVGDLFGAERHCAAALELLSRDEAAWLRAGAERGGGERAPWLRAGAERGGGERAPWLRAGAERAPGPRAGERAPLRERIRPVVASLRQLGLQLAHVAGAPIPIARAALERERLAEASLAAEKLSETYLFRNEPTRAFLAALTATNAAARLGPSLALARGYATLSVAFGYVPWKAVVDAYAARAAATAAALDDPRAVAFVSCLRGLTALGEGRCRDARALLTEADRLAEALQDRRRKEECITLLASVAHTEGRWMEALDRYGELSVAARQSDNAQGHVWAESGRAQCRLLLGDGEGAIAIFNGLAAEVQRLGDRSQQITHGQVALGYLLRGARDDARAAAERTLLLIRDGQPAGYHCLYGYAATCEVLLALLEDARSPVDRRELARLAAAACRAIARYARIFPLGRSTSLRLRGLAAWLAGRRARARRLWAAAIDEALARGLPVDEARARYELARHLARRDPARGRHIARAAALFSTLDLQYWQGRVERLRDDR
ncbi:serine/threonine-protein kinase [Sorangium sp. So ce1335]|uniref:serine/threonine-protein kinase n=1 Tax=Sorangium sp. So ce1335 TaxID=3133335 RepID=UPI003F60F100